MKLSGSLGLLAAVGFASGLVAACSNSTAIVPPLPPGWSVFQGGGDTICADGSEYSYFASPGTVNKLLIEFEGGGACWNNETCALPAPKNPNGVYLNQVDVADVLTTLNSGTGIYDRANPNNPWRDWYHVFIPYCTGDAHFGDNTKLYAAGGRPYTVQHKGRVNAQAAIDWVFANFRDPVATTVTGCSAGSLGSIAWVPYVMQRYPHADNHHFGDSFVGVLTPDLYGEAFPNWNAYGVFATFIPGFADGQLDQYFPGFSAYIYAQTALFYPQFPFSQYNSNFDRTQTAFYTFGGGQGGVAAWSAQMRALIADIHAQVPNFDSYIGAGPNHCYIPYDRFYQLETDGVALDSWVSGIVRDERVQTVVDCAPNCGAPAPSTIVDHSRLQH